MNARLVLGTVVAIGATKIAPAQQTTPPVHPVGAIVAKTVEPIGYFGGIHALADGRVVVNDVAARRVLLFEPGLTTFTVLLDTSGATPRKYPGGSSGFAGTVIPFAGDSTVFYDPVAIALVLLDPQGRGFATQRSVVDPFVLLDEWTLLPDGTVAIIRGQDYHLDFIAPDGKKTSSAKLPFQWHPLSDSDKAVIIDSAKRHNEANPLRYNVTVNGQRTTAMIPQGVIALDSLADYRPPFRSGAMLADAEGNVWIEPTPEVPLSPNPGPVYDVVNRAGKLIDRVQLSPGFGIVGFSPGYVFMTIPEGTTTVLVKAKIRQ